jgi:hypothetical protein
LSRVSEIAALVRLAGDSLARETLLRAIGRRWPEASDEEVWEALRRGAQAPASPEERLAMVLAAEALLRR